MKRLLHKIFPFLGELREHAENAEREGLAAKIEAGIRYHEASSELVKARVLSGKARQLNARNHFSEGLGETYTRREQSA